MKTLKVVYQGFRNGQTSEDFTLNQTYLARDTKPGFISVLNDKGLIVEMPCADFDFGGEWYSRNWLAFCKEHELNPEAGEEHLYEFIKWTNQKSKEFRQIFQLPMNEPIGHLENWILFLEGKLEANEPALTGCSN